METWQILIYTAGAIGGTLAGITFAAVSYYLLSHFALKESLSLPDLIHFLITGRFFTLPRISWNGSTAIFKRIHESLQARIEHFVHALQAKAADIRVAPVQAAEDRIMPIPVVEDRMIAVQIQDPVPVPVPVQALTDDFRVGHDEGLCLNPQVALTDGADTLWVSPGAEAEASLPSSCHAGGLHGEAEASGGGLLYRETPFTEPLLAIPEVEKPLEEPATELLAELQYNVKIAREFSGDQLVPLRTDVWDTCHQAINTLPGKVQNELENIYTTIKILNNLVWFSTEFHRQSPALSEEYGNLLSAIAGKVNDLNGSQTLTLIK